jgi:predicted RNase H-like nuclease
VWMDAAKVMMMETISGVDGCSWGWLAVTKELPTGRISWSVHTSTESLFEEHGTAKVIAIDVPIGLPERGARICDLKARQLLGAERGQAIFAAPTRPELSTEDTHAAKPTAVKPQGRKRSWHALRVLKRVMQVDAILRRMPALRERVHEIHPEVSFFFLGGGRPTRHSKQTSTGRSERESLLAAAFGRAVTDALTVGYYTQTTADDVFDAFAALWTAERIHNKKHLTLPPAPPLDTAGLRMEIVA